MLKFKYFIFVFLLFILNSCSVDVEVLFYIDDLIRGKDTVQSTISIPYSNDSSELENIVKKTFIDATNFRVKTLDYQDYLVFDTKFTVSNSLGVLKEDSLFNFYNINQSKQKGSLFISINKSVYDLIVSNISLFIYTILDSKDIKFSFKILNNTYSDTNVSVGSVYVDRNPIVNKTNIKLSPNKSIDITLSDVFKDYIFKNEDNKIVLFDFDY